MRVARSRTATAGWAAASTALALTLVAPVAARADLDAALWNALLGEYTTATSQTVGTRVDYRGLAADPRWSTLLAGLEAARPTRIEDRGAKLAFWINAYNILAIRMVIEHYPVDSIRDVGSFLWPVWKREIARIEGEPVTLHQIEHEVLRGMDEPRIHGAIVCASTSCPSLARQAYRAETLDAQLDATMRRWMADARKGLRVDRERGRVTLSRIFRWFREDFESRGGSLAFAARHAPEVDRRWIEDHRGRVEIDYFDYDWTLNDWRR